LDAKLDQKYIDKLIKKIYILLPTFEGRHHSTKEIVYDKETAYKNFQKNLDKLKIELIGCMTNFEDVIEFVEIVNIIEGLKTITLEEHYILKQQVFNLIDICKKIKKE
jgi:hypothetical protein